MRISVFFLSALSVGTLVVLGPAFASAQDSPAAPIHKRTGAGLGHKRVVNSRRADLNKRDALSALQLLNATIVDKATPNVAAANAGADPSTAVAGSGVKTPTPPSTTNSTSNSTLRFPDLGFKMPTTVPDSLDGWWADDSTEYAFLGFSYEITACQSLAQLKKDFENIRTKFNGRYIRLYGTCDNNGYYNDIVTAAWDAGLGVHGLVWFGFNGGNEWEKRRDELFAILKSNPKARYVTRVVQFGSEPLFDSVLSVSALAAQVIAAEKTLKPLGIPVTVSDMVYGFTKDGGSKAVLEAIDQISIHMLPFFSTKATTGANAWPLVESDINWALTQAPLKGKKIILDENAWPSEQGSGVKANSQKAVASVSQQQAYFDLLDSKCSYFKQHKIGWMFHVYSNDMESEYGLYGDNGKILFPFHPKTSC
ncbi:glycoside hydrolase family 17 protein [Piloderma croceum F 1598]|uniref:glucan endo-1,3-beta-D-glucosidase n=1 Tax=Piloderma croceum (strain F 1598) TaxID=765440 RepID=A0A0C3BT60_PILCF|nr:glycoside hydrolase family 17 protein [Piloderma croceum F 1598]